MSTPTVLYLSLNDGSDTRINKEVWTLGRHARVHFVGVQQDSGDRAYVRDKVSSFQVVRGRRRAGATLLRLLMVTRRLLREHQPDSLHVVNEDLAFVLSPVLHGHPRLVLDVFDSLFLKRAMPRPAAALLQRYIYGLAKGILVTDGERAGLMPALARDRLTIVQNYPYAYTGNKPVRPPGAPLRIYVNGTVNQGRGTAFMEGLLGLSQPVEATLAGWLTDDAARALSRHPRVRFLGTVPQQRSMELAAAADYILCLYQPSNQNNLFASPNKIYDAVQAGTPVIINRETRVARFVEQHGLGVVLDSFFETDFPEVHRRLMDFLPHFRVPPELKTGCTWEAIEHRLLAAHGIDAGTHLG